jgi:hypothetical protein
MEFIKQKPDRKYLMILMSRKLVWRQELEKQE